MLTQDEMCADGALFPSNLDRAIKTLSDSLIPLATHRKHLFWVEGSDLCYRAKQPFSMNHRILYQAIYLET